MDKIEEIIDEFALSPSEVDEIKDMMHEEEFKERFYRHSEPYHTVFYDCVLRYVEQRQEEYV